VAARATQVLPVIDSRGLGLEIPRLLVAVSARSRQVAAGQGKMRFLVSRQSERGRLIGLESVAAVAGVEIRSSRKLPRMPVGMAVSAARELDFEQRVLPLRNMTLRALQPRMPALQRIRAGSVLLHGEGRWFPALHVMTRGAFSAVGTFGELAVVRIGLVAVHALGESQRFLKVASGVALGAINRSMFAEQREPGLRVVEAFVHALQRDFLPSTRAVAGLAGLREAAAMRVLMAVGALAKRNSNILRLAVVPIGVALGALRLDVQAGQGIAGLGVIELADVDGFPIFHVVARLAVRPQAPFVLVFMARDASRGQAEIGACQILGLNRRPFLRRNVGGIVALVTS